MPRALVQRRLRGERAQLMATAREHRARVRSLEVPCNHWLFEDRAAGELVEFVEGPDEPALLAALQAIAGTAHPILHEVELR